MRGKWILEVVFGTPPPPPPANVSQIKDEPGKKKKKAKAKLDTELTAKDLQEVIAGYKKLVHKKSGEPFPQDVLVQLAGARNAVFRSWWNDRAAHYRRGRCQGPFGRRKAPGALPARTRSPSAHAWPGS